MKKKILLGVILIVLVSLIYFIYSLSNFQIFDVEVKKITDIDLVDKPYKLGIYYVPSNASSQCNIQIREIKKDSVLKFYERYNFLKEYKIINDTLILLLSDTSLNSNKTDTLFFKLP